MAQMARERPRLRERFGLARSGAVCAALVAVTLLLGCAGIGWCYASQGAFELISRDEGSTTGDAPEADDKDEQTVLEEKEPAQVCVHVDGAVKNPGVYVLLGESPRVGEAVELAGGLAEDANTTKVNLAAPLADGEKVYIPHAGDEEETSGSAGELASAALPNAGQTSSSGSTVNLNTATAEELQSLPGVGEATARAIIEERERGGPFTSIEDVMRVSGIGEKKFERMREFICV